MKENTELYCFISLFFDLLCFNIKQQRIQYQKMTTNFPSKRSESINHLQGKKKTNLCQNCLRMAELQLELQGYKQHLKVITLSNRQLLGQITKHEQQIKNMNQIKAELNFMKQSQQLLKAHLQNYQSINEKLRMQLQSTRKNNQSKSFVSMSTPHRQAQRKEENSQVLRQIFQSSNRNEKKSKNLDTWQDNQKDFFIRSQDSSFEIPKNNHLLTPKSKMKLNIENLSECEIKSFQKINARRKAFM